MQTALNVDCARQRQIGQARQRAREAWPDGAGSHTAAKGENGGLTKDELIGALRDYPGQISKQTVDPLRADIYEYVGQARRGGVEYDLVVDGVLSDLTLSCEYDLDRKPLLTIESLHVL